MKPYRRFYAFFIGLIPIFCALWVLGIYTQLGNPLGHEGSLGVYERYLFKKDRADSIKEPKLIVTSGSNGLYGISAERLEEELGVPSVNMAITAPLGMTYILQQTRSVMRSGDCVIAPLEYSLYESNEFPGMYIDYVISFDPEYFRALSLTQKARFLAATNMRRFFIGFLRAAFRSPQTLPEALSSLPLNAYGDTTNNTGQKFDGAAGALENFLLQEEGLSEAALRTLSDFIDDCEKNGVRFFAAYPSLFYDKAYLSETTRKKIAALEAFCASKNVPVLGKFEDFLYPIGDMYDSLYHLNAEGREKRTRQMVELLKPYMPAKPEGPR
jgi:hypothetical protein